VPVKYLAIFDGYSVLRSFRVPQVSANMNLFRTTVLSSLVVGAACRQFEIPEVANAVAKVINHFDSYIHYHGNPTETAVIPPSSGVPSTSPQQSTPYWYEEITHQGISAFGPSGYVVYRNVKDYGATGIHIPPVSRIQC